MKISLPVLSALALSLALGACSTPSPESLAQNDPWERPTRDIFDFDVRLDHAVARPIAKGYRAAVPEPVRDGIHNALSNLNSPVVLANDVLQGDGDKAVDTAGRIVINSTVGLGGLIDVASKIGIPGHDNDFGITLGQEQYCRRLLSGAALRRPDAAPRSAGQGCGPGLRPPHLCPLPRQGHLDGGALRHRLSWTPAPRPLDAVETIERSSIDFYATTRNLYRQSRNAKINGGKTGATDDLPNL